MWSEVSVKATDRQLKMNSNTTDDSAGQSPSLHVILSRPKHYSEDNTQNFIIIILLFLFVGMFVNVYRSFLELLHKNKFYQLNWLWCLLKVADSVRDYDLIWMRNIVEESLWIRNGGAKLDLPPRLTPEGWSSPRMTGATLPMQLRPGGWMLKSTSHY